jgi:hypothetical protein
LVLAYASDYDCQFDLVISLQSVPLPSGVSRWPLHGKRLNSSCCKKIDMASVCSFSAFVVLRLKRRGAIHGGQTLQILAIGGLGSLKQTPNHGEHSQRAPKSNPIQPVQHARYLRLMLRDKLLHEVCPQRMSANRHLHSNEGRLAFSQLRLQPGRAVVSVLIVLGGQSASE